MDNPSRSTCRVFCLDLPDHLYSYPDHCADTIIRMLLGLFTYDRSTKQYHRQGHCQRILLLVLKNVFGYVFIVAVLLMLMLPGQGIITILINHPGSASSNAYWNVELSRTGQLSERSTDEGQPARGSLTCRYVHDGFRNGSGNQG